MIKSRYLKRIIMQSYYSHSNLTSSENTLHNILDIVSDGVWDWNVISGKVKRNAGWYEMLDYDINTFENHMYTWENNIHPEDYQRVIDHFEEYIKLESSFYDVKYRCRKKDGSYLWIQDSGKIVSYTDNGKIERMIGSYKNINNEELYNIKLKKQNELLVNDNLNLENVIEQRIKELKELNKSLENKIKEVEYTGSFDTVTKIFNRRKFEELFDLEINRAKRYSHDLSVILIDIDKFKKYNDIYGHKKGDEVLFSLASLVQNNIRKVDIFARWGGEEFIIVLPNTSPLDAFNKAEYLREKIENTLSIEDTKVTCSFGVSSYIDGDDERSIFLRIDKALYLAKHNNRNNVKVL